MRKRRIKGVRKMRELRPCPGCGDLPGLEMNMEMKMFYRCPKCGICADGADLVDDARVLWNKMVRRREKDGKQ